MLKQRVVLNRSQLSESMHVTFPSQIVGVMIDNYSGSWLQIAQEGLFVPPYTLGWSADFYGSRTSVDIIPQTPPFLTNVVTIFNTLQGDVVASFYDEPIAPSAGYSIAPAWFTYMSNINRWRAATFRTLGDASTTQVLLTIENGNSSTSTVVVGIRRVTVSMDTTGVDLAVAPWWRLVQTAGMTGGTALTKNRNPVQGGIVSNAQVFVRGATASDGGVATAIAVGGAGGVLFFSQGFAGRQATAVGQVQSSRFDLHRLEDYPLLIVPGDARFGVRIEAAAAASNPATNHYLVEVEWEEYSLT